MKKIILFLLFIVMMNESYSQGVNHQWLLGTASANYLIYPKARMFFDTSSYTFQTEYRKMAFKGTEATICDAQGNFLMSSNGVWIANANNDTMMNGGGLNPGSNVNSSPNGLLNISANIFLPYPGDSNKFILFHHTDEWDGTSYPVYEIFYSIINMTLDSGRGGVLSKNNIAFSDTLNWGLAACRHANGRDWWIITSKHNSNIFFKILYTPNGIASITSQQLNVPIAYYNTPSPTFSQMGDKFIYNVYDTLNQDGYIEIMDFDRCSGMFSNEHVLQLTNNSFIWGLAFSPSGKYIYACSSINIFQIDTDSLTVETVATWDGFYSGAPPTCCATTFWNMYLAANGKIYITTGNGTQHIHEMNFPDSAGIACDVQQHVINLGVWNFRAVPNHPNYYLGPVIGSVCDSLPHVGINEINNHDFHFSISPNPVTDGYMKIIYLLPQNKPGWFEAYDVTGKKVYKMPLPPWSTLQQIKLPKLANGIYNAVITSAGQRAGRKIAVMGE